MAGDQFNLGLLDDDDYKVSVLRTRLLGIAECFMYRLPRGSKSPFRADGWPLTKPLQCVSLRVERRGDVLLLIFTFTHGDAGSRGQQKLFALCPIDIVNQTDNEKKKVDHFVEAVLDSTRYFVVRVKDEKADREALIGLGFRDREEAGDFRAALAKYEQDIKKEYANR
uniref:NECAP PHear domain-containing protein n=1 Tax=Pseudo-nitzschia australis TaxID=44445 RepID=A0A7S4EF50_9STRA|mmetsp:Transcript_3771/g.8120  ORF Transcript_3771/g.8120 Transcript_3771/m.8120 type:complete len:168 (+) Transcript_3771:323-826(+)|eukprot:CAMPEP_0168201062 /NCGR_PEP_ID=MMETSP0139_2-20121125/23447_1 /TAXON_ID=44445 /ORGANISM="Pseudo-nitzschia australis, Strain 10249 10 AB" /LENGTH=167 /DNA_ID=CAMNT_0008126475 /DNA_START=238 /DNA_END=741 /DNA_ORIENTATION=-